MISDVRSGIRWGLYYAVVYGAFAVATLVAGANRFQSLAGVGLLVLIGLFLAAGIAGGAIFGALLPLGRSFLGAIVVGVAAASPFAVLVTPLVLPAGAPIRVHLATAILGALSLGSLCGALTWLQVAQRR
jgi:hypothetical protein